MRSFLRFLLFVAGQLVLWIGVFIAIGSLGDAAQRPEESDVNGPAAAALGAMSLGIVLGGVWLSRRAYRFTTGLFNLAYAVLAAATGLVLLPVAMALGQFEAGEFDPGRTSAAALYGAVLSLVTAGWLGWLGWRWIVASGGRPRLRAVLRAGAISYGVALFLLGASLALAVGGAAFADDTEIAGAAALAGFTAVTLLAGTLFTYHGINALMNAGTGRFQTLPAAAWLAIWLFAILFGYALLEDERFLRTLFPAMHVIAAASAGFLLVALVARQSAPSGGEPRRPSWRSVALCWAWGAAAATLTSIFLELIFDSMISIGVLAGAGAFEGVTTGADFGNILEHADFYLSARERLVGALLLFSVSPPLIEESMKALGVRLLGERGLSRYDAFLYGVTAGAGFGTLEAVFYGASALEQDPAQWWRLMLLRGGATSMHAIATGIFALGIYYAFQRRPGRFLGLVALAMLMHGAWNGLSVIASSDTLPLLDDISDDTIETILEVILGAWSLFNVAMLFLIARTLWGEQPSAARDHPPLPLPEPVPLSPAPPMPDAESLIAWRRPDEPSSEVGTSPPDPLSSGASEGVP